MEILKWQRRKSSEEGEGEGEAQEGRKKK